MMITHTQFPCHLATVPTYGGLHWIDYTNARAYNILQRSPRPEVVGRKRDLVKMCDAGLELDLLVVEAYGVGTYGKGGQ
jgi:hypothetical protein